MESRSQKKSRLTLLLFSVVLFAAPVQAQNSFTFTGGELATSPLPSIIVPLLSEAFKRNGLDFSFEHNPSLRSLDLSNTGMRDGEIARIKHFHKVSNNKYSNLLRIETELVSIRDVAYSVEDISISDWQGLKGLDVAYYRGRKNTQSKLEKILEKDNIIEVSGHEHAFKMLASGRVDIVITDNLQGAHLKRSSEEAFNSIKEVAVLGDDLAIHAFIHKKHVALKSVIERTLEEMKADGTFSRIVDSNK